ncbi:MAG TPA: DUF4160 domain-containing protein [Bacteroidales bacterium]
MDNDETLRLLQLKMFIALNLTTIAHDGSVAEIRKLVGKVNNVNIEIYPNEHPPPHFHVKSDNFNVTISIKDCQIINGQLDSKTYKQIKYFYASNRQELIDVWNNLRPSDCPVGPIKE